MPAAPPPEFTKLHVAWWLACAVLALLLWLRPRPRAALALLIVFHGAAYLAYYGNLARPYAVGVSSDRSLGVGMAMATADGGSPFDHIQVEFGNLEPLWTFLVAVASGFSSAFVPVLYDRTTLVVLALTALGFYAGWSGRQEEESLQEAGWRGAFVAAAVLGLSSHSLSGGPTLAFWHANFVFKPNHALGFGLVGVLSRWAPARRSWIALGLVQGLLIWVFILDWAYLLPGLVVAALISRDRTEALKRTILGTALGLVLSIPYLVHLLRDYNPVGEGEVPQIWRDLMGDRFLSSWAWSLDMGLVLILFLLALVNAAFDLPARGATFGFLLTAPLVALGYSVGLTIGFAPEPDEGYFYVRMVVAAGAGVALWEMAKRLRGVFARPFGPAFSLILALSFPAWFEPWRDDRYYRYSLKPEASPMVEAAAWLRENTGVGDVLVSSRGIMLSGMTGRRFLMVRPEQTADRLMREQAEQDILTSMDEAAVRRAAARYRVTVVVLDGGLRERYGEAALKGLGNRPWFEPLFTNSFARIVRLKPLR